MKIGEIGERTAETFLVNKEYKMIRRNYFCKAGEIDIIAEHDGVMIFIEVKTRSSLKYGRPSEAVNWGKQRHIHLAADWFIAEYGKYYPVDGYRFDVIEILRCDGLMYLNHIENAF